MQLSWNCLVALQLADRISSNQVKQERNCCCSSPYMFLCRRAERQVLRWDQGAAFWGHLRILKSGHIRSQVSHHVWAVHILLVGGLCFSFTFSTCLLRAIPFASVNQVSWECTVLLSFYSAFLCVCVRLSFPTFLHHLIFSDSFMK